jgi:DNA-binding beta-propeller fold protein YncE
MACSSSSSTPSGECTANSGCASGQVCSDGECVTVCETDAHCADGEICVDATCRVGTRSTLTITGLDGDDPDLLCPNGGGSHCVATGIVVHGTNLDGASFDLRGAAGGSYELVATAAISSDTEVHLALPEAIAPDTYTLTVANALGSVDQVFDLIQGPPGPDKTPDELVESINGATLQISVDRLPVGTTAADVAAGQHDHGLDDLPEVAADLAGREFDTVGIPWANGITYDPVTDALYYMQYNSWTVGRIDMATKRDALLWWNGGSNHGQGVAVVRRPLTGAYELWFSTSNWGYIYYMSVSSLVDDPQSSDTHAGEYTHPCGGFSGLGEAEAFSGVPDTYISTRSDRPRLQYWLFGSSTCADLVFSDGADGETVDLNAAIVDSVQDGRTGGISPHGMYHHVATHTVWITDVNNGTIWIFSYDPTVLASTDLPLLVYEGRIRTPTWSPRGLAYDPARKLVWTCQHSTAECRGSRFDIDAFLAGG